MPKTKSFIQSLVVNGGGPKPGSNYFLVRAPKTMKCFRATFVVNSYNNSFVTASLWIATEPTNNEQNCVFLNAVLTTVTNVPPASDNTAIAPNVFIFDRRGVGYMEDEFYLYSEGGYVTIVWEGISEE